MVSSVVPSQFGRGEDATVGRNVQSLRKARGMSQEDLAQALSSLRLAFHQSTIAKVEAGTRPLKISEANAIATALSCEIGDLVREETTLALTSDVLLGTWKVQTSLDAMRNSVLRLTEDLHDLRAAQERAVQGGASVRSYFTDEEQQVSLVLERQLEEARLAALEDLGNKTEGA